MKKASLLLSLLAGAVVFCAFDLTSSKSPFESTNGNPSFTQKKQSRLDESTFWEKETSEKEILSKDTEGLLNAPPPETGNGQKLTGETPPPLPLGTDTASLLFLILLSVGYLMIKTRHIPFKNKGE